MVKIEESSVSKILIKQHGWEVITDITDFEYYRSPCRRFTLQKSELSNMFDPYTGEGWSLHIDNSDMCSLATCDVEYIEQVLIITSLYQSY